jgi:hypothetical protein
MSDSRRSDEPDAPDSMAAADGGVGEAISRIEAGDLASPLAEFAMKAGPEERELLLTIDRLARRLRRVVFGLRRAAGSIE